MEKEQIDELEYAVSDEHQTIYYNRTINYNPDGTVYINVHYLVKVGKNIKALPAVLYIHDTSIEKLTRYQARIIHNDETFKYSLNDLHTISLANPNRISEDKIKILPITDIVKPGDIIEIVSIHKHTLPQLGFSFSPALSSRSSYNIRYSISFPVSDSLIYKVYNGDTKPEIKEKEDIRTITFYWPVYHSSENSNGLQFKNSSLEILSNIFKKDQTNYENDWSQFCNWYIKLIAHRLEEKPNLTKLAQSLTENMDNDLDKMNAIFRYVQSEIRYEQVFMNRGGFIPNDPESIEKNKYGDCKDYSCLMFVMAKSIGLCPNLALCYRGRGVKFHEDLPVSQFNHMILHFEYQGQDYWYDGTNRTGMEGLTTKDLINHKALILEPENTRFITIEENPGNLIDISGTLHKHENALAGKLLVQINSQYAIDFFYADYFLNEIKLHDYLVSWFLDHICSNMSVKSMHWQNRTNLFEITVNVEIPNSIISINDYSYISLSKIFDRLIKFTSGNIQNIDYYADYAKIKVDITVPELSEAETTEEFRLKYSQSFDPGPFNELQKDKFFKKFAEIDDLYQKKYKLITREN